MIPTIYELTLDQCLSFYGIDKMNVNEMVSCWDCSIAVMGSMRLYQILLCDREHEVCNSRKWVQHDVALFVLKVVLLLLLKASFKQESMST